MTETRAPAPDFLVIGAYKAGTTSLHHWLRAHPDLFVPTVKEPSYWAFADGAGRGHPAAEGAITDPGAYARLFAGRAGERLAGEVSPAYLAVPGTAERVAGARPDLRWVAVLRDPVERAYSDYLMYVRDGREDRPFLDALAEQEARRLAGSPTGHYDVTGRYGEQLVPWLSAFPEEQGLVVLHEEVVAPGAPGLHAVLEHLGVDPEAAPAALDHRNVSGVPSSPLVAQALRLRRIVGPRLRGVVPRALADRVDAGLQRGLGRPPLDEGARRHLAAYYAQDLTVLERLLDRDLSAWRHR